MWYSKQYGTLIIIVFSVVVVVGIVFLIFDYDSILIISIIFALIPMISILLFYQLIIEISEEKIKIKLGIGLIRKSIALKNIQQVIPVVNSGVAGWGYRILPEYTMFNVTGFKAIEIVLKGSKRKIRVGTDKPKELAEFINKKIDLL